MAKGVLKFFHSYLVFTTPLALLVLLDGQLWPSVIPLGVIGDGVFSTITGILFLLWLLSLLIFLGRLAMSAEYRSFCFKCLAGIQERDEREELIVGRAAKSSFLFMLSILLILFFVSTWRYSERSIFGDVKKSFTIGHFDLIEGTSIKDSLSDAVYYPVPVSKTSLLIFVIGLQILSFRYFSRKAAKSS